MRKFIENPPLPTQGAGGVLVHVYAMTIINLEKWRIKPVAVPKCDPWLSISSTYIYAPPKAYLLLYTPYANLSRKK